jgi:ABC-2 type transport system permease protein
LNWSEVRSNDRAHKKRASQARKKNRLYIATVFLAIVVALQCYAEYKEITKKAPEKIIEECERLIESMENMTVIQTGDGGGESGYNVETSIDKTIEQARKEIERARRELETMDRDWRINAREEIELLKSERDEAKAEGNAEKQEQYDTKIRMLEYHLERDIEPDEEYAMKATVITDIITFIGSIFLAIVVMMLTVDTIAFENSPGTMKFLLTKPVSRNRVYLSKFIASLIASLGIVLSVELIAYLVIGIIFGFGNMLAPAAIGTRFVPDPIRIARYGIGVTPVIGSTVLVPYWQKFVTVLLMQVLYIMAVTAFGMFISAVAKNGVSALIIGLLSTAVLTVMTVQINGFGSIRAFAAVMPFLFSTYSAGGLVLSGFLSKALSSSIIGIPLAVSVMSIWAILFFVSGHAIFTRKDILI